MNRSNWLTEVEGPQGTTFLIRQRRDLAMQVAKYTVITLTVLIVSAALVSVYADHQPHVPGNSSAMLSLILILLTILWGLATLAIVPMALFVYFRTKDWSEFCIGPDSVTPIRKLNASVADRIPRNQISEYSVFSPQGQSAALTVNVTVYPATLSGALARGAHEAGNFAGEAAGGMAQLLAQFNCGVRVNAQGQPVPLAAGLSSTEAEYLFHRMKYAFERHISGDLKSGQTAAAPTSIGVSEGESALRKWTWLLVCVAVVYSLRWVIPALEPK